MLRAAEAIMFSLCRRRVQLSVPSSRANIDIIYSLRTIELISVKFGENNHCHRNIN